MSKESLEAKKGISGSAIKIIALITMVIDHSSIAFLAPIARRYGVRSLSFTNCINSGNSYAIAYIVGRLIGRLSFLLFCFFLVEGYKHTRNKYLYAFRLFAFSIISEIPFDLFLRNKVVSFDYQNVFFTLLLGYLGIWLVDGLRSLLVQRIGIIDMQNATLFLGTIVAIFLGIVAEIFKTDYGFEGVATIVAIYMLYELSNNYSIAIMTGAIILIMSNLIEVTTLFDIAIIAFYKGRKGINLKYLFYFFYPAHLLLLYFLK